MKNPFEQVAEFHQKFELRSTENFETDNLRDRLSFMNEEMLELFAASLRGDKVKTLDAVLDIIYVAIGTGLLASFSPEQLRAGFEIVHAANMRKVKGADVASFKQQVGKPPGWVGPEAELEKLL